MNQRTHTTRRLQGVALAGAVVGSLAATHTTQAAEPTSDELLAQAKKLIAQAEAKKADEAVQAETKEAALDRVLADADRRSSSSLPALMQVDDPDPFTAGHNGKFLLASEDGRFTLNPNFQLQVRYVANFNSVDGAGETGFAEEINEGLELRRVKIGFKGNAYSKDLTYDIKFAFNRNAAVTDDDLVLENGFIDYTPASGFFGNENLGIRIGQYKDPTFFEEAVSSTRQLAADRSLLNETLAGGQTDFIQGVGLIYKGDKVKGLLSINDGLNSDNTDFADAVGVNRGGLAGRVDVTLSGDESAFKDFTALTTETDSSRIGGGFFLDLTEVDDDYGYTLLATIDYSYETANGLGLFLAGVAELEDASTDTDDDDTANFGAIAKVSQVLDKENGWEVFGQYNFILFDEEDASGEDLYHEVVGGVNKYWVDHKVKMTIDAGVLPVGNPGSNSGIGYQSDGGNDDPQLTIRGQFQLLL